MKCFCCLISMQPFGVHSVPDAFSNGLGFSAFEELLPLSPHLHLTKSFGFPIEWRSGFATGFNPFGSQDASHHEKCPKNWGWNQLKVFENISNGDGCDPRVTSEHADDQVADSMGRSDDASTQDVGFHETPQICKD